MVIDGDLHRLGPEIIGVPLVGLIKRQRQEYFSGAAQGRLLGLPAFHRSNAFVYRAAAIQGEHVARTFFLRWQTRRARDDFDFGLLRVETAQELDTPALNELSRDLIAEGRPTSSGRNGNHLYPIAFAEQVAKQAVCAHARALPLRWL